MKNNYKKLKDIGILVLCDFASITVSVLLSLLIVHSRVDFCLELLYWYLLNIVTVYVFFALFMLYSFHLGGSFGYAKNSRRNTFRVRCKPRIYDIP